MIAMLSHCARSASKTCLQAMLHRDVAEVKVVEVAKKLIERIAENNLSVTFNTRYYAE